MMCVSFDLSVVISSYNRDNKVLETLRHLFRSDFSALGKVEVIIVDDGSPLPVENVLPRLGGVPDEVELKVITQERSGVGATRNKGFRASRASIVLFLDDDILVERDTLNKIVESHRGNQRAVVFGSYPFVSHSSDALHRFASRLFDYGTSAKEEYEPVHAITSGLLSVNKRLLSSIERLYKDDLTTPAAEEYEIIHRLYRLQVPIFRAKHIRALHNHHLNLAWLAQQQYKYGLGTAEAFCKYPEIVALDKFSGLKSKLDCIGRKDVKGMIKLALASRIGRETTFWAARMLERLFPSGNHSLVFGLLTSSFYWAGYLEGVKRFATKGDGSGDVCLLS